MKDEILETSTKHPIFALITVFLLLTFLLVVIAWFLAEFKAKRWGNDYVYLKRLVAESKVTQEHYTLISKEFDDLDWNTEDEHRLKQFLWAEFQYKFREMSKYKL